MLSFRSGTCRTRAWPIFAKEKYQDQKVGELLENDADNYQTGNHRPSVDVKVQHITLVNGVAGMELE